MKVVGYTITALDDDGNRGWPGWFQTWWIGFEYPTADDIMADALTAVKSIIDSINEQDPDRQAELYTIYGE